MSHDQKPTGSFRESTRERGKPRPYTALFAAALGLRVDFGPAGEDGGGQAPAGSEFAADDAPFRADGGDDVTEEFVDRVFVENAQAAVGEEIHFQGFQLDAVFFRHVL